MQNKKQHLWGEYGYFLELHNYCIFTLTFAGHGKAHLSINVTRKNSSNIEANINKCIIEGVHGKKP